MKAITCQKKKYWRSYRNFFGILKNPKQSSNLPLKREIANEDNNGNFYSNQSCTIVDLNIRKRKIRSFNSSVADPGQGGQVRSGLFG